MDVLGDHAVSCQKGLITARHFGITSYLCQVLTTAKIPFERESACLGDGRRPGDVLLKQWEDREDHAIDVTVVHPLHPSGTMTPDGAKRLIKQAGEHKEKYYADACGRAHVGFSPSVFDT